VKILLRALFQEDSKRALAQRGAFSAAELDLVTLELDAASESFSRFLEITKHTSGSWFNPIMKFTSKELGSVGFYQLECRKTLTESERDHEANSRRLDEMEPITTDAGMQIKLLDKITLSKVSSLKPYMVAGVDQWTAEFVIAAGAASAFEADGLTGFSLRPLCDARTGEAHARIRQLYCDSLMPPAVHDRTTPPADDGGVRQLGCLVYDERLEDLDLPDFNRTAEDWSSNRMPIWVVSARVKESFARHKLRGWAFRPVLEKGSDLHGEYAAQWERLFEQVSINPRNFF